LKRRDNSETLVAHIYEVVGSLTRREDKLELLFSDIWDELVHHTDATAIEYKPRSMDFGDLGIHSDTAIAKVLVEVFGATKSRANGGRGSRSYYFNKQKLDKLGQLYDMSVNIQAGVGVNNIEQYDVGIYKYTGDHNQHNPQNISHVLDPQEDNLEYGHNQSDIKKIDQDPKNHAACVTCAIPNSTKNDEKNVSTELDIVQQLDRLNAITAKVIYTCIYCNDFQALDEQSYTAHILRKHRGYLAFPTEESLMQNGGRIR
jgi:hypothetical protein